MLVHSFDAQNPRPKSQVLDAQLRKQPVGLPLGTMRRRRAAMRWLLPLLTRAAASNSSVLHWHSIHTNATKWADDARVNVRTMKNKQQHECARIKPFVPRTTTATLPPPVSGRRVAWFMSMSKPDDEVSATYVDFARAATASARLNAPTLYPFFL